MPSSGVLAACLLFVAVDLFAQQPKRAFHLVLPTGPGAIVAPQEGDWQPASLNLYDHGSRPVLQFNNKKQGLTLSYSLFPEDSGSPTAEACRKDVIDPLLREFSSSVISKSVQRTDLTTKSGLRMAVASYTLHTASAAIASATGVDLLQQNTFGFYGFKNICAEVHVSQLLDNPKDATALDESLRSATILPDYSPNALDYASVASIYYNVAHDYAAAAAYYQQSLNLVSASDGPEQRDFARLLTDQLSMSYGISGNLKRSRAINEAAIAADPDYPLYYYNLACADAESGDATAAQKHLQQAFDRRANTLKGEHMPDPTQDDSILKLKKDKSFWAFVQTLPRS